MMNEGSSGFGAGSLVIGGAILLILLFGIFGGNWGGNHRGPVVADAAGFTGATPLYSATDRDQWMNHCDTGKQIAALSSRTDLQVATILDKMSATEAANLRDQLAQERAVNLAKDSKIDLLTQTMWTSNQFADVNSRLCQLGFALERKPNIPSFVTQGGFVQPNNCCCPTNCCC